jgi:hypothetical protein
MNNILEESGLSFDFSACVNAERFDVAKTNPYGMKSVDFKAEMADSLYFIEIKNFQHRTLRKPIKATIKGKDPLRSALHLWHLKRNRVRFFLVGGNAVCTAQCPLYDINGTSNAIKII